MPTSSNASGAWSTGSPDTGNTLLDNAVVANGFRWRKERVQLTDIKSRLQHRHLDHTDPKTVKRYQRMAEAGNNAPPIGLTEDGMLIWGNHRVDAYIAAGRTEIDAYVFDVTALDDEEDAA